MSKKKLLSSLKDKYQSEGVGRRTKLLDDLRIRKKYWELAGELGEPHSYYLANLDLVIKKLE